MKRRAFLAALVTLPAAAQQVCFARNPPFYTPDGGTVGNGGVVTFNSAQATEPGWSYYPSGVAFTCALAGWYWTVPTSPTTALVYAPCYRGGMNLAPPLVMNGYAALGMGTRTFMRPATIPPITNTTAMGANLVIEGDSLTRAIAATTPEASYQAVMLSQYLNGEVSMLTDLAVGGSTMADLFHRASGADATIKPDRANVLIAWAGTNDIKIGGTAIQALADMASYCAARRAAGFRVIVATILPRSNNTLPNFDTERGIYNNRMRSTWWQFADGLADVAADNRIGLAGDELDQTYYNYDRTHLIDAGYRVVAPIFKAALDRAL